MPFTDPEKSRDYQRHYRREQRASEGCTNGSTSRLPLPQRIKTAADVLDLLAEQVEAVRADAEAGTLEKARCVGYLASVCLRAIEAGDLAARLEALEAVLKTRKKGKTRA